MVVFKKRGVFFSWKWNERVFFIHLFFLFLSERVSFIFRVRREDYLSVNTA